MSREHGEGGSFVEQMHVDMVMLMLVWWWWVVEPHLVTANLVGGHVEQCLRAEGGSGRRGK